MEYTQLLNILGLSPEGLPSKRITALQILASGEVPAHATYKRDGRAGKTFTYFKHQFAREVLRDGLGLGGYSLETLSTEFFPGPQGGVEGSTASALVRLTVYTRDGCTMVTEPGVFDNTGKLSEASARGSAASRGVCRCVMQAFGLGAEWYDDGETVMMSANAAWASIRTQATALGLEEEAVQVELKALGFSGEALGRQYAEAMQAVQGLADLKVLAKPEALDPVVKAAESLGAQVIEADVPAAIEENHTASDALAQAVADVQNWGEFYGLLTQTMGYPNTTAAQRDISEIFGQERPQKDGHPDWELIYGALREWNDASGIERAEERNEARDAVKKKYGPEEEEEDKIPF